MTPEEKRRIWDVAYALFDGQTLFRVGNEFKRVLTAKSLQSWQERLLKRLGDVVGKEFVDREDYIEIFSGFHFEENPISAARLWNEPTRKEEWLQYLVERLIDTGSLRGHIRTLQCFSGFLNSVEIISLFKDIAERSRGDVKTQRWQNEFKGAFSKVLQPDEFPRI